MMDPQVHSTLGPYDIKCFRFFTFDGEGEFSSTYV